MRGAAVVALVATACGALDEPRTESERLEQTLERLSWVPVSVSEGPAPRFGHAMAYDRDRDRMVLFGGRTGETSPLGDLWEFDGSRWHAFPDLVADGFLGPLPRSSHGMAFVPGVGVVIFGGYVGAEGHGTLADLWAWDGAAWTRFEPSGGAATWPDPRQHHALGESGEGLVVFGGYVQNEARQETFVWTPEGWVGYGHLDPQPSARRNAEIAHVSDRGESLLFGGREDGYVQDLWIWSVADRRWEVASPESALPPARERHGFAHHEAAGVTVLFGGRGAGGGGGLRDDTWIFDGSRWQALEAGTRPPARDNFALAYDPEARVILVHGGQWDAEPKADLWQLVYDDALDPDPEPEPGPGGGNGGGGHNGNGSDPRSRYACATTDGGEAAVGSVLLFALAAALLRRRAQLLLACATALLVASPARATAAGEGEGEELRLAFLGLQPRGGVTEEEAEIVADEIQAELFRHRTYQVIAMSDIRTVLGYEASRQLMDCGDDTLCLTEIGGALDVRRLLSGTLSRVGDSLIVNLALIDSMDATAVNRISRRIPEATSVESVLDAIGPAVAELVGGDPAIGPVPFAGRQTRPAERVFTVGARFDGSLLAPGLALGLTGALDVGTVGGAATLLLFPFGGLRLEGAFQPFAGAPVSPRAAGGVVLFHDAVLLRLSGGIAMPILRVRVMADLAWERLLVGPDDEPPDVLFLGLGAGWTF